MLGDLLKIIELLTNTIKGSRTPDYKRAVLARDLLTIYKLTNEIVGRGREVLALASDAKGKTNPKSVHLLSQQMGALRDLNEFMKKSSIDDVLQLHLPEIRETLEASVDFKWKRVCIRLDRLVGHQYGHSPGKWMDAFERKYEEWESKETKDVVVAPTIWPHTLVLESMHGCGEGPLDLEQAKSVMNDYPLELYAHQSEVDAGYTLLDKISEANSVLRNFIIEKTNFEDIL